MRDPQGSHGIGSMLLSMDICLVVSNMNYIFHFIYGMSSFPLTNSIIFQDGYCTTISDGYCTTN